MFNNKSLLITGGTGSFGKAVLDRFLNSDIREIRIFSRDEKKQDDLRKNIIILSLSFLSETLGIWIRSEALSEVSNTYFTLPP